MTNKYPSKKDIEEHKKEFERWIRLYVRGDFLLSNNLLINSLQTLFTDIVLDEENPINIDFKNFMKEFK